MFNRIISRVALWILGLRYRIRVRGLEAVAARGRRGILFLPNHPALIDPVILTMVLLDKFAPRALADREQIDRPVVRWFTRRIGVRPIPDAIKLNREGPGGQAEAETAAQSRAGWAEQINAMLAETVAGLKRGENALVYPAGRLTRTGVEDLGGNSAVETILGGAPEARVVLIRTSGLWGSSFSYAAQSGQPATTELQLGRLLKKGVWRLLAHGIFFGPRRRVDIELAEPADLPRAADRATINRYLERFYNQTPAGESAPTVAVAEGRSSVPPATRQLVAEHLAELAGRAAASEIRDEDRLANDLGLDSLTRVELGVWLEREFGFRQESPEALVTVGDVLLAACGEAMSAAEGKTPAAGAAVVGGAWRRGQGCLPAGETITAVFVAGLRRWGRRAASADQTSGVKTYRGLAAAIMALGPAVGALPGEYVGIMLPASVAADMFYLATLFAGKTPVMVNWTLGSRNMLHSLDLLGVRAVLTAKPLVARLEADGVELGGGLEERFVFVEEVGRGVSRLAKLRAGLRSRLGLFGPLARAGAGAAPAAVAAVLFTSGSESLPKAVPLTHANILANLRDSLAAIAVYRSDSLLGMLPPFHSMGLAATMLLPLCAGVPVVHHPNPTAGAALAGLIDAFKVTLVVGTPTFLGGIVRAAAAAAAGQAPTQGAGPRPAETPGTRAGPLATLRLIVAGAEKCPPDVYAALARQCPRAAVCEGYGVTECSPMSCVNSADNPRPGTIGLMLPSVEWAVVDVDTGLPVPPGSAGMLLLRGPSIFAGYLHYDGPSPFVQFQGRPWYRTGDLVRRDADGVFTFAGRLKRFVKLGGEMISLPAIEEVLAEQLHFGFRNAECGLEEPGGARGSAEHPHPPLRGTLSQGERAKSEISKPKSEIRNPKSEIQNSPLIAVEATASDQHPEIVLFTTLPLSREQANAHLRAAGLSPLHNIRRVVQVETIPVLGTGKTDYRALRESLAGEDRGKGQGARD